MTRQFCLKKYGRKPKKKPDVLICFHLKQGDFSMPMINFATCSNEDLLMYFAIDRINTAITEEIRIRIKVSQQGEISEQDDQLIEAIATKLETMEETDSDSLRMPKRQKKLAKEITALQQQLLQRMQGKASQQKRQRA